jgi:hypothetical protein
MMNGQMTHTRRGGQLMMNNKLAQYDLMKNGQATHTRRGGQFMMNDILVLYDSVTMGIKKTIRNFFLLFLVILFGAIILVIAFSQRWITVAVNLNGHAKPLEFEEENYFDQRNDESILNNFQKNRLFDIVRHPVEPGETLIDLEKRYGTNWEVIQKLNRINDPIRLTPGEMIWVPVKSVPS